MRRRRHREGPVFFVDLDEDEIVVVSVKVRKKFVEAMDRKAREYNFKSRSDFIREAISWFMKYIDSEDIKQAIIDDLKKRIELSRIAYENQNMSILAEADH